MQRYTREKYFNTFCLHDRILDLISSFGELQKLYESKGVTPDKEIISYCRIGERSSHTWFVLKYLLGYPNIKNYDGSWTEWRNLIDNPIER